MKVIVVGSGKPDAELGETQWTVVAPLLCADPTDVRDGETHLVGSILCSVVV